MTNKTTPAKERARQKSVARRYSNQEVRDVLIPMLKMEEGDPEDVLRKLGDALSQYDLAQAGIVKIDEETSQLAQKAMGISNLDNHYFLALTAREDYRPFAIELANQLIQEYDCTAPSEKALVQQIVSARIRSLEYARDLSVNTRGSKPITSERNGMYTMLSKEIDRANRQFIAGLTTLKQLKSPALNVSVKANTAFIANNQQINATKLEPPVSEIN